MIHTVRSVVRSMPVSGWVVLATTYLATLLVAVEAPSPLRVPVLLGWALLVPGLPWARLLRLGDGGDLLTVAVALSLAALATVGGLLALLGAWDFATAFRLLAAVAVVGAVGPVVRAAVLAAHDARPERRPS